jgi:hypothetical protein
MTEEAQVISINGTDYTEDQLDERQKYLINAIQISRQRTMEAQISYDRERIALDGLTAELIKSVEEEAKEKKVS